MGLTGQVALSSPQEEVQLWFDTSNVSDAVNAAENGDQITLYAGSYSANESSALNDLDVSNNKEDVYVVALPGAELDYASLNTDILSQISDLNQLADLDDILDPLDQFLNAGASGDGQMLFYDAGGDRVRFTDVIVADDQADEVKVNDKLIAEKDLEIATETEPSVKRRLIRLENLLPTAPSLKQKTSPTGSDGKVSFGPSSPISGVTNVPGKDIAGNIPVNNTSRGIIGTGFGNLNGTLNGGVSSSDNHGSDVFGRAKTGTLRLIVNGNELSSVRADLTQSSSIDTINGVSGANGFDLSSPTELTFADGTSYQGEYQRSGTWQVDINNLRSGYNSIQVQHYDGSGSLISETTPRLEYVFDDEGSSIGYSNLQFSNLNITGINYLSGIPRNNTATAKLSATVSNVYLYTYSNDSDAVDFPTKENFIESPFPISDPGSASDNFNIDRTVDSEEIVFNEPFKASLRIQDPVEQPAVSNTFSRYDFLIDDSSNNNSDLEQYFDGEGYRFTSDRNWDSNLGGNWDSTKTIENNGDAGYNDGLQCRINSGQNGHSLEYPTFDYTKIGDSPPGVLDYSTQTDGERYFYGYFTDNTATTQFIMDIDGVATLVQNGTASNSSDEVEISIKLPTQTGWMDVTQDFVTGQTGDGDGAFAQNLADNNPSISGSIGLTTGTKSTANSFDKMYYRITAPEGWTGHINSITINWVP